MSQSCASFSAAFRFTSVTEHSRIKASGRQHVGVGGKRLEDKHCDIFLKIVSQHSEVKIIKAIKTVCGWVGGVFWFGAYGSTVEAKVLNAAQRTK